MNTRHLWDAMVHSTAIELVYWQIVELHWRNAMVRSAAIEWNLLADYRMTLVVLQ